ncbi:MAG: hypothetical protein Q9166_005745 [cf. Caloplaca sp. 2 TL-2023]
MPLKVLPCDHEDLDACLDIQWQASEFIPLWQFIFPNGGTPALRKNITYHMQREYDDPSVHFLKVIDTSKPNKLIAYAKWTVVRSQTVDRYSNVWMNANADVLATPSRPPHVPAEETNELLFDQFMAKATPIRNAHIGTQTIVLDNMSVLPDQQRQGAGKLLLQTLVDFADERTLPCYVESTPFAHNMYIHQGFRDVDKLDIDLGKWKRGYGVYTTAMLHRDAKGTLRE